MAWGEVPKGWKELDWGQRNSNTRTVQTYDLASLPPPIRLTSPSSHQELRDRLRNLHANSSTWTMPAHAFPNHTGVTEISDVYWDLNFHTRTVLIIRETAVWCRAANHSEMLRGSRSGFPGGRPRAAAAPRKLDRSIPRSHSRFTA